MQDALQASKNTVGQAIPKMDALLAAIKASPGTPLNAVNMWTFIAVVKWLKVDSKNLAAAAPTIQSARDLMDRNRNLNPPLLRGGQIEISGVLRSDYHAYSTGSEAGGVNCGDMFFNPDGPNCRRDVVTHELFHMLGVHHGGAANDPVTHRELITTPAQALDSADNLAQLVAQIITSKGVTDACTRAGE